MLDQLGEGSVQNISNIDRVENKWFHHNRAGYCLQVLQGKKARLPLQVL